MNGASHTSHAHRVAHWRQVVGAPRTRCRYGTTTTRSTDGSRATISRHLVEDRNRLAVVPVAVDGEQHARLDLSEAVEHALHAEVRRARRPDRAAAPTCRASRRSSRACWAGTPRRDRRQRCPCAQRLRERASTARAARRATSAARTLSSPQNTSASPSSSARRRSSRFCAKLSWRPGTSARRACGRRRRSTRSPGVPRSPRRNPTFRARTPACGRSTSATASRSRRRRRRASRAMCRGERRDVRLRDALRRRLPELVMRHLGVASGERRAAARRSCSGSGFGRPSASRSTRSSPRRRRTPSRP